MNVILTLNIDKDVVENAEMYAKSTEKSVSQLVEDYLSSIPFRNRSIDNRPLGPITRQLTGIIKLEKEINRKELLSNALSEKYI